MRERVLGFRARFGPHVLRLPRGVGKGTAQAGLARLARIAADADGVAVAGVCVGHTDRGLLGPTGARDRGAAVGSAAEADRSAAHGFDLGARAHERQEAGHDGHSQVHRRNPWADARLRGCRNVKSESGVITREVERAESHGYALFAATGPTSMPKSQEKSISWDR